MMLLITSTTYCRLSASPRIDTSAIYIYNILSNAVLLKHIIGGREGVLVAARCQKVHSVRLYGTALIQYGREVNFDTSPRAFGSIHAQN